VISLGRSLEELGKTLGELLRNLTKI
jgi:hypothetical protein